MFKIVPSEPTDFFPLVRLLKLANYQTLDIGGSKVVNNFISAVADNGDIAGIVGLETYDYNALLRSLATDKRYADQGVAETLIQKVENTAIKKGMRKIYTLAHTVLQPFFEAQGYELVAKNKVPLNIKKTDEYVFFRDIEHICMLKKTENFVEADEDFEVYTEQDLRKHVDK